MLTIISYKKAMKRKVHFNESYRESHRVRRDTGSMMEKRLGAAYRLLRD